MPKTAVRLGAQALSPGVSASMRLVAAVMTRTAYRLVFNNFEVMGYCGCLAEHDRRRAILVLGELNRSLRPLAGCFFPLTRKWK